jgi:membrane protein
MRAIQESTEWMTAKVVRELTGILGKAVSRWSDHDAPRLGAAIAYYAILSLAPLAIFLLAVVSIIFGSKGAIRELVQDAGVLMGNVGANVVRDLLVSARKPAQGLIATGLATLTLMVGASAVFGELRDALNTMWGMKSGTVSFRSMFVYKLFSFALVLAAGLVLLVSMLATAAVSLLAHLLTGVIPVPSVFLESMNFVLSLSVLTAVFALIFRFVPDLVLPWKVVGAGAAVSALLFVIGKTVVGLYLSWASVGSAYGAAGSLVAIAVWIFYSAQIFLFGAEFTYVWAEVYFPSDLAEARNRPYRGWTVRRPDAQNPALTGRG